MDALYMIGAGALIIAIVWLLTSTTLLDRQPYRCQKCGFETYNEVEASGHEKMENGHKVVKE